MTLRNAPLSGRDDEGCRSDLGPLASEISEFQKFVARPSRRLPLRLDRILGNRLICPDGQFASKGPHFFRHGRACPGHPRLSAATLVKTWMPGTSPGMTSFVITARFR